MRLSLFHSQTKIFRCRGFRGQANQANFNICTDFGRIYFFISNVIRPHVYRVNKGSKLESLKYYSLSPKIDAPIILEIFKIPKFFGELCLVLSTIKMRQSLATDCTYMNRYM